MSVSQDRLTIGRALREHWPEYLMEVWGLGTFMVSAGLFAKGGLCVPLEMSA